MHHDLETRIRRNLVLASLLGCLASGLAGAQTGDCLDYADYWHEIGILPGIAGRAVALDGDLAYVGDGSTFLVVDIADPTSPTIIGSRSTGGLILDIAVVGDLAYLANDEDGVWIMDVSQPEDPQQVFLHGTPDFAVGIDVRDDRAYVAGLGSGVCALDVSDPASPIYLGSLATPGTPNDVVAVGDYLYCAAVSGGLVVIDIGDGWSEAEVVASVWPGGQPWDLVPAEDHPDLLYVGVLPGGLKVVDISEPTAPVVVGSAFADSETSSTITTAGHRVFISTGSEKVYSFDASDPAHPVLLGRLSCQQYRGAVVARDRLLLHVGSSFDVIDATVPASVPDLPAPLVPRARWLAVDGGLAFTTAYDDGHRLLMVIDAADPAAPVPLAAAELDWRPVSRLATAAGFVYACKVGTGTPYGRLEVVDATDPLHPAVVEEFTFNGQPLDLAIAGDHAYAAVRFEGLTTLAIADPTAVIGVDSDTRTPDAAGVAAADGLLVFTYLGGGADVYDLGDPAAPELVGSVALPGDPRGVAIAAGNAYVADHDGGLWVVDLFDPTQPAVVADLRLNGEPERVVVDGGVAYVTDYRTGLHVVDVADPAAPAYRGRYPTPRIEDVAVVGDLVFATGERHDEGDISSLHVLLPQCATLVAVGDEAPAPGLPLRLSSRPNPFNPVASVRFELPQAAMVRLVIHDAAGRVVRSLVDGVALPAGSHERRWDGRGDHGRAVASGVYLCRLEAGQARATARLTLIR